MALKAKRSGSLTYITKLGRGSHFVLNNYLSLLTIYY